MLLGADQDEQLNESAFRAMYEQHYRSLLAYALRRAAQPTDAHDVVSETFLAAWRRHGEAGEDDSLPWLYGIARRVLANQARAGRRRQRLEARLAAERERESAWEARGREQETVAPVLAALARLRPLDQEVLRLVAWEGLGSAEIAASFGCSVNAATIRLHRARRRLREELEKEAGASGHISQGGERWP